MNWNGAMRFGPAADGWARLGAAGDADRRLHYARLEPFLAPTDLEGRVQPYLTRARIEACLRDGRYRAATSINPSRLRQPDELLRGVATDNVVPCSLTFEESMTLARLAGGRLASEKETDFLLSSALAHGRFNWSTPPVRSWTSTSYDLFAYSLTWFDPRRRIWVATDRPEKIVSSQVTTITLDPSAGHPRRQPADPQVERHAALVVREA